MYTLFLSVHACDKQGNAPQPRRRGTNRGPSRNIVFTAMARRHSRKTCQSQNPSVVDDGKATHRGQGVYHAKRGRIHKAVDPRTLTISGGAYRVFTDQEDSVWAKDEVP